jgi:hypothetical protein
MHHILCKIKHELRREYFLMLVIYPLGCIINLLCCSYMSWIGYDDALFANQFHIVWWQIYINLALSSNNASFGGRYI